MTHVQSTSSSQRALPLDSHFGRMVGIALEAGFALTPVNDRVSSMTDLGAMLRACNRRSPEADIPAAEKRCAALVQGGAMTCTRFLTPEGSTSSRNAPSVFTALTRAEMTPLSEFTATMLPQSGCTPETAVMAMIYVARACNAGVPFTLRTMHAIVTAAVVVASKVHEETPYSMRHYGRVSGMTAQRVCQIESALLNVLKFDTFVSDAEFAAMVFTLRSAHYQRLRTYVSWRDVTRCLSLPEGPVIQMPRVFTSPKVAAGSPSAAVLAARTGGVVTKFASHHRLSGSSSSDDESCGIRSVESSTFGSPNDVPLVGVPSSRIHRANPQRVRLGSL